MTGITFVGKDGTNVKIIAYRFGQGFGAAGIAMHAGGPGGPNGNKYE